MRDANDFIRVIKRAAIEAVNASQPTTVCVGTVTSASPIKIAVNEKLVLGTQQLVIPVSLTNHKIKIDYDSVVDKEITVKNALKEGNKVMLIRQQGGQKYFVIDKVV